MMTKTELKKLNKKADSIHKKLTKNFTPEQKKLLAELVEIELDIEAECNK